MKGKEGRSEVETEKQHLLFLEELLDNYEIDGVKSPQELLVRIGKVRAKLSKLYEKEGASQL